MSTRKPLLPPGLRELIKVLAEASELLPSAADNDGWKRREELERGRWCQVRVQLQLLADELVLGEKYPGQAAECLANRCEWSVKMIRGELAKPLGYEPVLPVADRHLADGK